MTKGRVRAVPLHERTEVSGARASAPSAVEAQEQVPDGLAPSQRQPAPALMLRSVVQHVAPLAERLQVSRPVLGRVVVEVSAGQDHPRGLEWLAQPIWGRETPKGAALPVSPHASFVIPPAAISEVTDQAAVGSPAALAAPLGTTKADDGRELGPVDRVEPAMLSTDRHPPCILLLRGSRAC